MDVAGKVLQTVGDVPMLALVDLATDVVHYPLQGGVVERELAQQKVHPLADHTLGVELDGHARAEVELAG